MKKVQPNADESDGGSGKSVPAGLDFAGLVSAIREVHAQCAAHVRRTVNTTLTVRNWVIGAYIREYEQNGADRAAYGVRLLETLAVKLQDGLDRCYTGRYLGLCRQLFDTYPEIRKSVISESRLSMLPSSIATESLPHNRKSAISELPPPHCANVDRLSFTHLIELMALDDPLKRAFYEIECIRGNWSVRQLKRQVATLYFERSGLSEDKRECVADSTLIREDARQPTLGGEGVPGSPARNTGRRLSGVLLDHLDNQTIIFRQLDEAKVAIRRLPC